MLPVAYEWDFEEIVGLRGVSVVSVTGGPNSSTNIFAVSGELGALVQMVSPIIVATTSLSSFRTSVPGLIDAVGNQFAHIAYVKVTIHSIL